MRVGHWIAVTVVGLFAVALFGQAEGQQERNGAPPATTSPPGSPVLQFPFPLSAMSCSCVGAPPAEIGPPRLIPGFDMNSLPDGKVVGLSPKEMRIREILSEPADFALVDVPLKKFVAQVAEKYKFDILIDVPALLSENQDSATLLTAAVSTPQLRGALREVLGQNELTFAIRNQMVIITTKTAAEMITPTRTYQVHDLVNLPNDPANFADFESLIELLTSTISPESWREAGGTQGEVKAFHGPGAQALVITQTEELHEQVERLFADLRAARLPEVYRLQQQRMRRAAMSHPYYIRN